DAARGDPDQLQSIRIGACGGAPVSRTMLREFQAMGVPLVQSYGLTEGGGWNLCLENKDALRKLGSAGKPMLTSDALVVDDAFHPVAPGEVGEIVLRGPAVISEYWGNPQATAAAFHNDWLRTG